MSKVPPWSEGSEFDSDSDDEDARGRSVQFVLRPQCDKELFWFELTRLHLPMYDAALLDPEADGSRVGWFCLHAGAPEESLTQVARWLRARPDVLTVKLFPARPK